MKKILLVIITLIFSLTSFSQETTTSEVSIENNEIKYTGDLGGEIYSFDMSVVYKDGKEDRLRSTTGKITDEMLEIINNKLPESYSLGDTTTVYFMNIKLKPEKHLDTEVFCEGDVLVKLPVYYHQIIF